MKRTLILILFLTGIIAACNKKEQTIKPAPQAYIQITGNPAIGDTLTFTAGNLQGRTPYWTFSNSTPVDGATVTHVFNSITNYNITLAFKEDPANTASVDTNLHIGVGAARLNGKYHWYVHHQKDSLGHDTAWNTEEDVSLKAESDSVVIFNSDDTAYRQWFTFNKVANNGGLLFHGYQTSGDEPQIIYTIATHDIHVHLSSTLYAPHARVIKTVTADYRLTP